jgi:hypothetical protein
MNRHIRYVPCTDSAPFDPFIDREIILGAGNHWFWDVPDTAVPQKTKTIKLRSHSGSLVRSMPEISLQGIGIRGLYLQPVYAAITAAADLFKRFHFSGQQLRGNALQHLDTPVSMCQRSNDSSPASFSLVSIQRVRAFASRVHKGYAWCSAEMWPPKESLPGRR